MLSSLKSHRKQLKILLIIYNTQIFMGSSSCSCICPCKKYETEAIEKKIQRRAALNKKAILKYIKESLK